jgi:hypothetical protein
MENIYVILIFSLIKVVSIIFIIIIKDKLQEMIDNYERSKHINEIKYQLLDQPIKNKLTDYY